MDTMAYQITGLAIVYSTVFPNADQRKVTSKFRVTGLCAGNPPVNSPHIWPVTRKMFPFDDVIMHMCVTGEQRNHFADVIGTMWTKYVVQYNLVHVFSFSQKNNQSILDF